MALSARQRPSESASGSSRAPLALPEYQSPTHPLNQDAQNALRLLPTDHKLDPLKQKLENAIQYLGQGAAEVNDRLQIKVESYERNKRKREAMASQGSTDENSIDDMDRMRNATFAMTKRLDGKIRDVIDAKSDVEGVERALQELHANITANRGVVAPTQGTLGESQFANTNRGRSSRRNGIVDEDEDEQEETQEENTQAVGGAIESLRSRITEQQSDYHGLSLSARYASHNDYVGFKKLLHDAQHPGESAPPLPHKSTWFAAEEGLPGTQQSVRGANDILSEDDEGIQVAAEKVSVRCPITLVTMSEPMSSTKCPHSFEKSAILSMLNNSDMSIGSQQTQGRRAPTEKAMKCPVCEVLLTKNDLAPNPVLLRKIKRIQAKEAAGQYGDDEDGEMTDRRRSKVQRQEVTSSPAPSMSNVKRERISQPPRSSRRNPSVISGTQMQSLDDDDDDEVDESEDDG